jgi:AcrR family transcriptional regulator
MANAAAVPRLRNTQEERSAATRARLLDATIECLFERGYSRTTTSEIAERAGMSRGAQLHHFPTKSELVTTAVEHLFERRITEFREAFASLPPEADRKATAIDLLWSMISGPSFYAWLELVVAARTDPELREKLTDIGERFSEAQRSTFQELFPRSDPASPVYELVPMFAFAVLQGLALDGITMRPGDPRIPRILEVLKLLAKIPKDGVALASGGAA